MKILITGIDGFIGKYISNYLDSRGHKIIGVTRCKKQLDNYRFEVVVGDLAEGIFYNDSVDVVIHMASSTSAKRAKPSQYINNNIVSTLKVLEYCEKYNVKRLIYFSSIEIHGTINTEVLDVDTEILNPNIYGMTKYMSEELIKERDIDSVMLRLPGVIGLEGNCWLANAINKIYENTDISIFNPNSLFNNTIHVNTLARFINTLVTDHSWSGENILTIGACEPIKLDDLINSVISICGSQTKVTYAKQIKKSFIIDIDRAINMGYKPNRTIDDVRLYLEDIGVSVK